MLLTGHLRWAVVLLTVLFSVLMGWSNVFWTEKGGVIDDAILDVTHPSYRADKEARLLCPPCEEPIVITLNLLPNPELRDLILRENLLKVGYIHHVLEHALGKHGVLVASLATTPAFRMMGEKLASASYTDTLSGLFQGKKLFDIEVWRKVAEEDPLIPLFYSFDQTRFFLFPSANQDEIKLFRAVAEVLEERTIPTWEWFVKADIFPKDRSLSASGWIIARGIIDGKLNQEVISITLIGLVLSGLLFWCTVRSVRQAIAVSLCVVVMSILWVRGEIGLLEFFGFQIRERVYALLAYTNCIVQGTSFSLHLLSRYNGLRRRFAHEEAWRRVQADVAPIVTTTAVIGAFGFSTLYFFEIRAIRELGILAALGVLNVWALSVFLLPLLAGSGIIVQRDKHVIESFYGLLVRISVLPLRIPAPERSVLCATLALGIGTLGMAAFLSGNVPAETRMKEFVEGTSIERNSKQDPVNVLRGHFGTSSRIHDFYNVVVPYENFRQGGDGSSTTFKKSLTILEHVKMPGIESVFGLPYIIEHLRKKTGTELQTEEDFRELLNFLKKKYPFHSQLMSTGGYRLVLYAEAESPSVDRERGQRFREAGAHPFGKLPLFPTIDEYVIQGKFWNMLSSEAVVVVLMFVWIGWRNSRRYHSFGRPLNPLLASVVLSTPFVVASGSLLIGMWLLGTPLDAATAAIGALAINATVDFTLYLAFRIHAGIGNRNGRDRLILKNIVREGKVIWADALLNSACFLPLAFSSFAPVERMGWIMVSMIILSALATLAIAAPLVRHTIHAKN